MPVVAVLFFPRAVGIDDGALIPVQYIKRAVRDFDFFFSGAREHRVHIALAHDGEVEFSAQRLVGEAHVEEQFEFRIRI